MKMGILIVGGLVLLGGACSTRKNTTPAPLARVGVVDLTRSEAEKLLLDRPGFTLRDVVLEWTDRQLLYQAAVEEGYQWDESLRRSVAVYRQRILGKTFLQTEAQKRIRVTSQEVNQYYQEHGSGFTRPHREALIRSFTADAEQQARRIKKILLSPGNDPSRQDLDQERPVLVQEGRLVEPLDRAVFSAPYRPRVVGPIQIPQGYQVIEIQAHYEAGSRRDLGQVQDEIYNRIYQQREALMEIQIIDSLKNNFPVAVNWEALE